MHTRVNLGNPFLLYVLFCVTTQNTTWRVPFEPPSALGVATSLCFHMTYDFCISSSSFPDDKSKRGMRDEIFILENEICILSSILRMYNANNNYKVQINIYRHTLYYLIRNWIFHITTYVLPFVSSVVVYSKDVFPTFFALNQCIFIGRIWRESCILLFPFFFVT